MTEKQKKQLDDLLEKLLKEKCGIELGIDSTCSIDCPIYINGAYGGECAIETVLDSLN